MRFGLMEQYKDFVEKRQGRKLVLFGAGAEAAGIIAGWFPLGQIEFICDNNAEKHGKRLCGVKICPPKALLQDKDGFVVLIAVTASIVAATSIELQLSEMGIENCYNARILSLASKIETYDSPWLNGFREFNAFKSVSGAAGEIASARKLLCDDKSKFVYDAMAFKTKYGLKDYTDICDDLFDEYFGDGVFAYGENEVFVDGGSYDGADMLRFAKTLGSCHKKSYYFEPDRNNYLKTGSNLRKEFGGRQEGRELICGRGRFEGFEMGLFDETGVVGYAHTGGEDSRIAAGAPNGTVSAVRLDDVIGSSEKVTFIKLDVEGAELAALRGMASTIKRDRPKLAISIYHKVADLWEIPLYVASLLPEYRLFVRHHSEGLFAKVLYAAA